MKYLILLSLFVFTSCTINTSDVSNRDLEYRIWELNKRIETLEGYHPKNKSPNKKRKRVNPDFVHNISIGNSVVLGYSHAPVTVTLFSDFQ